MRTLLAVLCIASATLVGGQLADDTTTEAETTTEAGETTEGTTVMDTPTTYTSFTYTTVTITGGTVNIPLVVKLIYANCQEARICYNNGICRDAFKMAFQNTVGKSGIVGEVSLALDNCQSRRLSELPGPASRRLSTPGITATAPVTVPAGQAASAAAAMQSTSVSSVQSAIVSSLQSVGLGNLAPSSVQSIQATPPSSTPNGFTACYAGVACYFNTYAIDTHYKIFEAGTNLPFQQCADACRTDANCEAFESLSNAEAPSCTLWMNGACNIEAGNPPGFVNTGVASHATTCEKDGARKPFKDVSSKCDKSSTLGLPLLMLSVFLVAAVMD